MLEGDSVFVELMDDGAPEVEVSKDKVAEEEFEEKIEDGVEDVIEDEDGARFEDDDSEEEAKTDVPCVLFMTAVELGLVTIADGVLTPVPAKVLLNPVPIPELVVELANAPCVL